MTAFVPRAEGVHAGVRVFSDYTGPVQERCEVVVVGSGPGGGVAAKELALRGFDVLLVEEGPPFGPGDFQVEAGATLRRLFRESGMRVMRGSAFYPTMQANCLGGGSVVNSAISIRAPGFALDKWANDHDAPLLHAGALDEDYAAIEADFGIGPTPTEVLGERNLLFKRGCDALGYSSEPTPRNARGCKGSAECFTGCRNGAKQSTDVVCVPRLVASGSRVFSSIRVEALGASGGRATKVVGHVVEPITGKRVHPVEIHAEHVVLAAGCMATPLILMKSGLANENGHLGKHLRGHPGLAVCAVFDHEVEPWRGATQGYHSLHFLKEGMKLEVLWAPPAILSVRLPGLGHELKQRLADFRRIAPFDVFVTAEHSRGEVRAPVFGDEPDIRFEVDPRDLATLRRGLVILSEIGFAAGAKAILPGVRGVPDPMTRDQLPLLAGARLTAKDAIFGTTHVFGSTRMGQNPRSSVVDQHGKVHTLKNVWIADTGVFAGSPSVNPMLTVMALARRTARRMAELRG